MAIVVVLVLLIAVGVGVGVAVSGKNKKPSADTNTTSYVSPTRPTFSQEKTAPSEDVAPPAADARTAAARASSDPGSGIAHSSGLPKLGYEKATPTPVPDAPKAAIAAKADSPIETSPVEKPATAPVATDDGELTDDEPDEDLSSRFNPRGERATGTETYAPTVPRKPVLLSVPEPVSALKPDVATAEPEPEPEPEPQAPPALVVASSEAIVADEPEFVLLDVGSSSLEDDVVADVVAASVEVSEPTGSTIVIELDESSDHEPVLVLEDAPVPLDEVEANDSDNVLKALIGRVRVTQDDVEAVATELERRDDLDAEGVAVVLADLAEIAAAEAEREEELTLFSEEVPSRPGQLTRFAELGSIERRRVIIRVLCLLVAQAEDGRVVDASTAEGAPARGGWPGDEPEDAEEFDLPNRVGLVKS